jgi:hypothetical protein
MEFEVTITYKVKIAERPTLMHLLDAVYQSQVGNDKGTTNFEPSLAFEVEEQSATFKEL